MSYLIDKDKLIEETKPINGYENYCIDVKGNVFNAKTGRKLKTNLHRDGYVQVSLCKDGKCKTFKIHRLVAEAFIPNELELPQVNHKDEDKTNNDVTNLEWCTREYNINYGTKNLRTSKSMGKSVRCVETGEIYSSIKNASEKTGFDLSGISKACRGIYKQVRNTHWEYVNQ